MTNLKIVQQADNRTIVDFEFNNSAIAWEAFVMFVSSKCLDADQKIREKIARQLRLGREQGHCTLSLNGHLVSINEAA